LAGGDVCFPKIPIKIDVPVFLIRGSRKEAGRNV